MTTRGAGGVHYAWVILGGTAVELLAASGVRAPSGSSSSRFRPELHLHGYGHDGAHGEERYSVGELSGWIFFSHQIGSAVGSLAGGYFYDRFGSYTVAFHSAAWSRSPPR